MRSDSNRCGMICGLTRYNGAVIQARYPLTISALRYREAIKNVKLIYKPEYRAF